MNLNTGAHRLVGASFRGYQGYQDFSFKITLCVYPPPGTYAKAHMYMKFCSIWSKLLEESHAEVSAVAVLSLERSVHRCSTYGLLAEPGNKTEQVIFIQEKICSNLTP